MFLLNILLIALAVLLAIPVSTLLIEVLSASFLTKIDREDTVLQDATTIAVLVPAHNEASGIGEILSKIKFQLRNQDTLMVVADNCTDETALIAREAGATVLERFDLEKRGKGYALDFGVQALSDNPPDVLLMMDADCRVVAGSLLALAAQAIHTNRPTQALYLFETPETPSPKALISAFAIKVKNWVRPLGLLNLGLPSLLFGTGMAFPWHTLSSVQLASSHIVEDMKLGFDLAIAGHPPLFCPDVIVLGELPSTKAATTSQRTRWEHGHLQVLKDYLPHLLWQAIKQRRFDLWALGLELSIPPLSLLVLVLLAALTVNAAFGILGGAWLTAIITVSSCILLISSIAICWYRFSRDELPLQSLLSTAVYMLWKIPIYLKFLIKPQSVWIKTERSPHKSIAKE